MYKFSIILLFSLFILSSCEKEALEVPGNIPGMGDTPGELEVRNEFRLPGGISLVGSISGIEYINLKSNVPDADLNAKSGISEIGSGSIVQLSFNLVNSGEDAKTVFFPKGLLWKSTSSEYQHALTLQTTWVSLEPNSQRHIHMYAYCINSGIPNPDEFAYYNIIGITGSDVMWNLLDRIGWKRINYEMIFGSIEGLTHGNSGPDYQNITDRLQAIVWNLTNYGISITAEDDVFIEGIPELYPSEIPPIDSNGNFPEYFEEFIIPSNK